MGGADATTYLPSMWRQETLVASSEMGPSTPGCLGSRRWLMIPDVLAYVLSHPGHLYRVTRFEPLPPVAECMAFEVRFSDMAVGAFSTHRVRLRIIRFPHLSPLHPTAHPAPPPPPLVLSTHHSASRRTNSVAPPWVVFCVFLSIAFTQCHTHTATVTQQVRVES